MGQAHHKTDDFRSAENPSAIGGAAEDDRLSLALASMLA
jgi:hypothetical protein